MRYSDQYKKDLIESKDYIVNADELEGKSVLITGSTGLIGSAVADYLLIQNRDGTVKTKVYLAGRDKAALEARFEESKPGMDYIYVPYECSKPLIIPGGTHIDYIIHLAGVANTTLYSTDPCGVMNAAIDGCRNALNYAEINPSTRVVYVSSSEIYGKNNTGAPYTENEYCGIDILNPRACYPSAKIACETMCAAYHSQYGTDAVIVRPGHIYGPTASTSDHRASSQFPRDVLDSGEIVMKSAGKQRRSYCYVADCTTAILTVMLNGAAGEAYNISNVDSVVSIKEMAEAFADAGAGIVRMELPNEHESKGYTMMDDSVLDGSKLRSLGWKGRFNMQMGAERTLEAMRYQR